MTLHLKMKNEDIEHTSSSSSLSLSQSLDGINWVVFDDIKIEEEEEIKKVGKFSVTNFTFNRRRVNECNVLILKYFSIL